VLIDAGYGKPPSCVPGITELGKLYAAGIQSQTLVSKPGPRRGRAAKKGRRDASNAISVKELAIRLRAKAGHTIAWREGTNVNGQLCYSASHEYSLRHGRRACAGWVILFFLISLSASTTDKIRQLTGYCAPPDASSANSGPTLITCV
jgi:hypothetical protein